MGLAQGSRVGPYEIVSAIGAGGMGEVFRAHDSKLNRDVAIKVLPAVFANDKERVARFRREAQVVASLNHPNIAAIYGLEESNGVIGLALELVEGEDLAQRLMRGAIPVGEAIAIARQIAEGLEAAHERGIVHRDLKPANIKLTAGETVKILDFGLAKAYEGDSASSDVSLANSPTMARPMTDAGMILGTAAYMSPEQARGKVVDKRADIWSFGVVLYEMLTGTRLFAGETVSDVLAAVLTREPDWNALPADVPPRLRLLLQRCLERDPKQRLRDIGDARLELARPDVMRSEAPAAMSTPRRHDFMRGLAVGLAVVLVLAIGAWTIWRKPPAPAPLLRVAFLPPDNVAFDPGSFHFATISPDGQKVVFSGRGDDGRRRLWVTRLDSSSAVPVPDSFEGLEPFWSPDSQSIAFGAQAKLKRADLSATRAVILCDAPRLNFGASWNREGVILFTPDYAAGIYRVSATGGAAEVVLAPTARDEQIPRLPSFLPDGRHFLYSETAVGGRVFVASLDSSEVKLLVNVKSPVVFAPPGWLLTQLNGEVAAQAFDAERLRVTGDPIPLAIPISEDRPYGRVSASDNGILLQQRSHPQSTQLVWFDRQGDRLGAVEMPAATMINQSAELSPDGKSIAIQRREVDSGNQDIWTIDIARGTATRLTSDPALDQRPVWSASGSSIFFNARRDGRSGIYEVSASGGPARRILEGIAWPSAATPDGRFLLFQKRSQKTLSDLWALPLSGGGNPHSVIASEFEDLNPAVSPDGRWIAYISDATGTHDVYVRALSADGMAGPPTRVTASGGYAPRWRGDGKELFFLAGYPNPEEEALSAVDVKTTGTTIEFGAVRLLFKARMTPFWSRYPYCVSTDGQRFLVETTIGPAVQPTVNLFVNWTAAVRDAGARVGVPRPL